jgi:hypothetical protein
MYIGMYVCMYVCMYVILFVCMYVVMSSGMAHFVLKCNKINHTCLYVVCMHVYMYVCVYTRMGLYIYVVCIYIHNAYTSKYIKKRIRMYVCIYLLEQLVFFFAIACGHILPRFSESLGLIRYSVEHMLYASMYGLSVKIRFHAARQLCVSMTRVIVHA